jgi:hypothetical protein
MLFCLVSSKCNAVDVVEAYAPGGTWRYRLSSAVHLAPSPLPRHPSPPARPGGVQHELWHWRRSRSHLRSSSVLRQAEEAAGEMREEDPYLAPGRPRRII